jgi:hypothetical protein
MTNKQLTQLFLFGGRCMYHGQYVNVVGKNDLTNTFTLQVQNNTKVIPDVSPGECKEANE